MKLTYNVQMIVSLAIVLVGNIISTILKHWIYRSAGFVVCGLLWIIHPVLPNGTEVSPKTLFGAQVAGLILISVGVFTRAHIY